MGWSTELTPGHDGYLVGLVPQSGTVPITTDAWRPLTAGEEINGLYLRVVQVGCTCGWRSPRIEAPIGCVWRSGAVETSAWFEDQCRTIWRDHAASVFADRERTVAR